MSFGLQLEPGVKTDAAALKLKIINFLKTRKINSQPLPWLLLAVSLFIFLLFMFQLQRSNDVNLILQSLKDNKEIILLEQWQATPYHCPHLSTSLTHCKRLSDVDVPVSFPRQDPIFSLQSLTPSRTDETTPSPNAARLTYRFKMNEIDWMKSPPRRSNALLLSVVVPRTSQDLMFVYTEPTSASQHGGRLVNVIANFGKEDLLESGKIHIDLIAPSYEKQFGPQTLPIALMTPSRTTPYLNLLNQMQASSLPATLLFLILPVLAAAMAVILDGSKIMFHISGYAFVRGLQALLAQTLNTLDGREFLLLGLPIPWAVTRAVFVLVVLTGLVWLLWIVTALVLNPHSRLASKRNRKIISLTTGCVGFLLSISILTAQSPVYRVERLSDILAGVVTLSLSACALYFHHRKYPSMTDQKLQTTNANSSQTLFDPIHFFTFRTLLVTITTLLLALSSQASLVSGNATPMLHQPLDWRQLILTPVLLLCAILGVGSVTQKMNDYGRMMRRRVEELMHGSQTLASSGSHAGAIVRALELISKEIHVLQNAHAEIILPTQEQKKLHCYSFPLGTLTAPESLPAPLLKEGIPPSPEDNTPLVSGRVLTLHLLQNKRWLGMITLQGTTDLFLTAEEEHFLRTAMQTLCLTLDNLTALSELRRADQLKDDFLANTSHELRTPLHGIVGLADALLTAPEGGLSQRARESLNLISVSGRRLATLVNDLLDFSQIKQRQIKFQPVSVELRPMVQLVLALNKPMLGKKNVELMNEVEPQLPKIYCDELRLQQILQNLIGNAVKFTQAGRISVSAEVEGRSILVRVVDTGIGIPSAKLQRIFNSFEQADGSISRIYGGTGLGLTITKQLVEMQGGTIRVDSQPDIGTTFVFKLPVADVSEANAAKGFSPTSAVWATQRPQLLEMNTPWWTETEASALPSRVASLADNRPHFKIMVIDDDAINRQVLRNQLQNENYHVQMFEDGPAALQALHDSRPDLILLDLMMPRMSGLEVLAEIRKSSPVTNLPVIILTAKNQIDDLVSCFHMGANDFLMKPFSQSELLSRMRNHLHISKIHGAYSRFIPQDFLELLGHKSIIDVRLGDQILRDMTVLFLDIRQFSKISEALTPKENFDFLNNYFATVNPVIRKNCGFIDKYIGDAVMALFPNRADDALTSGIELLKELDAYNEKRKSTFQLPIGIGIGIHHGPLMLGTLGNEERMEGTVISESVNLASRLEGVTKVFSVGMVTSQDTILLSQNARKFDFRSLGKVKPTGFSRSINIVEVFSADPQHVRDLKLKSRERHEACLRAFQESCWDDAIQGWKKILDENPADRAAALYLDRSLRHKQFPPPEGWDGSFELRAR